MFGNQLTEEQRQNGLLMALGIGGVAGAAKVADKVASGTKFVPYSKEFAQKQVQYAKATITDIARSGKTTLKNIGEAIGKKEIPKRISMEQVSLAGGPTLRQVMIEKQTIKEAYQKFTVKDSKVEAVSGESISKGTGKVYPTRQIDSVAEAHIIDRVKELRGNLTSRYKKTGNFAVAEVDVSGISKSEFYAQSSINELKGSLEDKVPDISLQPENPMFKATEAVGKEGESYLRNTDTEYKILNDIASRLGENTQANGKIKLFTELDTCDSCNKVIAEFAAKYKNIELEVIHNNGNRIIP
ncbi:deaminase domain-containing protein [Peribacillus simplex]|uniref:deaminase domain-containing protein n=1 Tax=Peribacillus simplex TaxID=1478 RepID=UPI0021AAA58B|nr:deaminase domain-containing protein [Peribacillus simplex]